MFKPKLSYANVAATLALFFTMTGGAMAAHHYLITSTKQISPKVVKALKGKTGKPGSAGLQGKEGLAGKEGKEGKEGKAGAPGTATLAWAYMDRTSTLKDVRNFDPTVTKPQTGVYCLTPTNGVSPTTSPIALLTIEWGASGGSELSAYVYGEASNCSAGQYEVRTYEPAGTTSDNIAFYIAIPS